MKSNFEFDPMPAARRSPGRPQGVLVDVDGTLIDSNDAHARAWVDALREAGYHVTYQEVRRLIGMGGDQLLPRLTGLSLDSSGGQRLAARRGEVFKTRYLAAIRPFPGARELLQRMRRDGLRLMITTSATRDDVQLLLRIAGVEDLVDGLTSSADAPRSKPAPDIVYAALRKLGLPGTAVLMLGDTPYDIEASAPSGVGVVALRCGGWRDEDLARARAIHDDPADLLRRYDESLFAGREVAGWRHRAA